MSAKNDITGDSIKSKVGEQNKYADGWEKIFGDKKQKDEKKTSEGVVDEKRSKLPS